MIIAGLQKLSLMDYPGKLSAVIFTHGCNFRCKFCHNPELLECVSPPEMDQGCVSPLERGQGCVSENEFFEFLDSRRGFLEGICVTGGEPLMQKDICGFFKKVKERGYSIKLDTNGYFPDALKLIINDGLIDYVAMDIKNRISMEAQKLSKYNQIIGMDIEIKRIKQSIGMIMKSGVDYEFRTTVIKEFHEKQDILDIAEFITGAKKYALQKFEIRDKILNDSLLSCSSITSEESLKWAKECEKFVKKVELRGWE